MPPAARVVHAAAELRSLAESWARADHQPHPRLLETYPEHAPNPPRPRKTDAPSPDAMCLSSLGSAGTGDHARGSPCSSVPSSHRSPSPPSPGMRPGLSTLVVDLATRPAARDRRFYSLAVAGDAPRRGTARCETTSPRAPSGVQVRAGARDPSRRAVSSWGKQSYTRAARAAAGRDGPKALAASRLRPHAVNEAARTWQYAC